MKEILYNPDNLNEKDITETVIRTKALIINKGYIYLAKEGTIYHFPGGHLEQTETLQECLKREVLEETGIELEENDIKEPFLKIIYHWNTKRVWHNENQIHRTWKRRMFYYRKSSFKQVYSNTEREYSKKSKKQSYRTGHDHGN